MKLDEYINRGSSFRKEIKNLLDSIEAQSILDKIDVYGAKTGDARALYRWLGKEGVLAPHWPVVYGGKGKSHLELGILLEEMAQRNIPFTLFVNSIQIAGSVLLLSASEEQKLFFLKEMAEGKKYGCVLYSEPNAGSDLSNLETKAVLTPKGDFQITGTKLYSMQTNNTNFAICAARVEQGKSKYEEITLFLIDLQNNRVKIKELPSLSNEPFYEIIFDDVFVDRNSVLGKIGKGWSILTKALAMERSGHDYFVRAQQTLNICQNYLKHYDVKQYNSVYIELSRLKAQVDSSRIFSYSVLKDMDKNIIDELNTSISKWYAGELASKVASNCYELIGYHPNLVDKFEEDRELSQIYLSFLNAPGNRLSAGTSEMMLQTITYLGLTEQEQDLIRK